MYTDRRTVCVVQMDSTECARKLAELITCVICESNTSEKLTKLTPVGLSHFAVAAKLEIVLIFVLI